VNLSKKWKELQKRIARDLGIKDYYVRKGLKEPDIQTSELVIEVKTGKNLDLREALKQAKKYSKKDKKIAIAVGRQHGRHHIDASLNLSHLVSLYLKAKEKPDFPVFLNWEDLKCLIK
jgi:hypothetical protein